jgi:DNA-directed RNA polymerase subunit RPC12/RpoP
VKTRKLEIPCPVCGSKDVFYSCTPNCCFNHVCAECGTTFEAADPTAECVKCTSTAVYLTETNDLVCSKCGALLELEITEVAPG